MASVPKGFRSPRNKRSIAPDGTATSTSRGGRDRVVKTPIHWENSLQKSIVEWSRQNVDPLDAALTLMPNGEFGRLSEARIADLKALGWERGWLDLQLATGPRAGSPSDAPGRVIFMEVKLDARPPWHPKTYLKPHQRDMVTRFTAWRIPAYVIRSIDDYVAVLDVEGVPHRAVAGLERGHVTPASRGWDSTATP